MKSFRIGEIKFKLRKEIDFSELKIPGQRILLESIRISDATDIFKEFSEKVTKYMSPPVPEKIEDTLIFIESSLKNLQAKTDLQLVIKKNQSHEFIGCIGLHSRFGANTGEFGIWIKQSAFGNRYGQEAVKILKNWAESNLLIDRFYYPVDKSNISSRKIPESLSGKIISEYVTKRGSRADLNIILYEIHNNWQ